ncbi:MAG: hypothetical protein ACREMU_02850, partial [Gemmatimonadaceae bacterium]
MTRLTTSAGKSRRSLRRKPKPSAEMAAAMLGMLTQHSTQARTLIPPTTRAVFVRAIGKSLEPRFASSIFPHLVAHPEV